MVSKSYTISFLGKFNLKLTYTCKYTHFIWDSPTAIISSIKIVQWGIIVGKKGLYVAQL